MIPSEILAQVRRIEIRTGRLVTETFAGQYLSVFKGRGMEFSEVREYNPGDDIRAIDWNVTARTGRPHVRRYQEERELTALIACDLSGSQFFGTASKFKQEVSAEIAAILAFAAMQNNDKVGLYLFTEETELFLPPKKGRRHILSLIRDLLAFKPRRRGTAIGRCLDTLNRIHKRRSILFLISDFQDSGYAGSLRRAARKHDLVPILIEDPRESEWPSIPAWVEIVDPESSGRALLNAGSESVRRALEERRRSRLRELDEALQKAGLSGIRIRTDRPYIDPIVRFFDERAKRMR